MLVDLHTQNNQGYLVQLTLEGRPCLCKLGRYQDFRSPGMVVHICGPSSRQMEVTLGYSASLREGVPWLCGLAM